MIRHSGENRTNQHNLELAKYLSFVAGNINVAGILIIGKLTTNITGYFAFFMEEFNKRNFLISFNFLLFVTSFFLGSFFSNLLLEFLNHKFNKNYIIIPLIFEFLIITCIAVIDINWLKENSYFICNLLLFSMGIQNSLVTRISKSVVRTTHLTGLFTDLGIEIASLLFEKNQTTKTDLKFMIKLKLIIINSFFLGGILSGILFVYLQNLELLIPSFVLLYIMVKK